MVGGGKGRKRRQNWNNERSEFIVVFNFLFQIRARAFIFMTVPKNYSLIVALATPETSYEGKNLIIYISLTLYNIQCVPQKRLPFEVKRCLFEFECFNSLMNPRMGLTLELRIFMDALQN